MVPIFVTMRCSLGVESPYGVNVGGHEVKLGVECPYVANVGDHEV